MQDSLSGCPLDAGQPFRLSTGCSPYTFWACADARREMPEESISTGLSIYERPKNDTGTTDAHRD